MKKSLFSILLLSFLLLYGCDPFLDILTGDENNKPLADAGSDQTVLVGTLVQLDGSDSSDEDGDSLSYNWAITVKPEGSTTVLSDSAGEKPTFTPDKAGSYTVRLVVNDGEDDSDEDTVIVSATDVTDDPNVKVINIWSFTDEVPYMIQRYKQLHPEFDLEIKTTIVATTDNAYQSTLDQALVEGGADAPDIYCAESSFVTKYTQGTMAQYALPYKYLGLDTESLLKEAAIAQYTVDVGSDKGVLKGLAYQSTGGAFIYRRSIAKDVWGSDDPAVIKTKIGPGWDAFFTAAAALKAKGYGIVSGDGDIWHPVENSSDTGWIVDGKLHIDLKREAFLDYSKQLKDNGYHNDTKDWTDAWYDDMKGAGPKEIFGFFGPAWLINYVMAGNSGGSAPGEGTYGDWAVCEPTTGFFWGGTWVLANNDSKVKASVAKIIKWITLDSSDTGLQYHWANGTLTAPGGVKDTVASATVMNKSDGTLPFLGGQNMFDIFVPACLYASGKNFTQYDGTINRLWRDRVREYSSGAKTRNEAITAFKQDVADHLGISAE